MVANYKSHKGCDRNWYKWIRTQQLAIVNVQLFLTILFQKGNNKGAFVQVTQRGVVARYNRLQLKGTMWDL